MATRPNLILEIQEHVNNIIKPSLKQKRKFNIKDGGNLYVFFTTNLMNEKIALITTKMYKPHHI